MDNAQRKKEEEEKILNKMEEEPSPEIPPEETKKEPLPDPKELLKRGRTVAIIFKEDPTYEEDEQGRTRIVWGQKEIKILPDGEVEFKNMEEPSDAAMLFWQQVSQTHPLLIGSPKQLEELQTKLIAETSEKEKAEKLYRELTARHADLHKECQRLAKEAERQREANVEIVDLAEHQQAELYRDLEVVKKERNQLLQQVAYLKECLFGRQMEEIIAQLHDLTSVSFYTEKFPSEKLLDETSEDTPEEAKSE